MKFILARKSNMTQVFGEEGAVRPATVLKVEKGFVSQIKNKEKDGYESFRVGFGSQKGSRVNKSVLGQFKEIGPFSKDLGPLIVKEMRVLDTSSFDKKKGDEVSLDSFSIGDKVKVSSISKGKGFQGVVKRHGFAGGPRSHGQKHSEREPGSIGGSGGRAGGRVAKNMRMAGRMGGERVTIKNLKVLDINIPENLIVISGAIAGRRGTWVEITGI